ncbi:MAG: hypothetical protein P0107_06965 [Nitrosomonas sp.]|nr:hypothetical protein [Nitrosomonas sp.]
MTHRAVSSITPVILPAQNTGGSSMRQKFDNCKNRLTKYFSSMFTAYPGNSGSPLYDPDTGEVYGVVVMGFAKGKKSLY